MYNYQKIEKLMLKLFKILQKKKFILLKYNKIMYLKFYFILFNYNFKIIHVMYL